MRRFRRVVIAPPGAVERVAELVAEACGTTGCPVELVKRCSPRALRFWLEKAFNGIPDFRGIRISNLGEEEDCYHLWLKSVKGPLWNESTRYYDEDMPRRDFQTGEWVIDQPESISGRYVPRDGKQTYDETRYTHDMSSADRARYERMMDAALSRPRDDDPGSAGIYDDFGQLIGMRDDGF